MKTVTSTEAARGLGELLSELGRGGQDVIITRNGSPVARLSAAPEGRTATLGDLARLWAGRDGPAPHDPGFTNDLELVQKADGTPENPWRSSSTRRR